LLSGSINHISVTVSDLDEAMAFFRPLLEFLGYTPGPIIENSAAGTRLTVNINGANGTAFNVWEAKREFANYRFEVYAPGLHHVAFNVASHSQVDQVCDLVGRLGGQILDGPGEFPYADDGLGYYAVYFLGPNGLKFECVHMPGLEGAYRAICLSPCIST
jgi:glyoxylase I family protein